MAHGFRREKVRRRGAAARGPVAVTYLARLDGGERSLLASLLIQVLSIVAPPPAPEENGDEFDRILAEAGLSHLDAPGDVAAGVDPLAAQSPATSDLDDPERDPALDRLIPDAHRQDPLVSAEFRRMAAPGLRARKAANLESAIAVLARAEAAGTDEVRLDEDEAQAFAVALTDVRLVVGERLALRTDEDADRLERALARDELDEQTGWLVAVYDFLTWLQETLTQAMLDRLDDRQG